MSVQTVAEDQYDVPRVASQYSRTIYTTLWNIASHLDARSPVFMTKRKRSHSMGSVQALIVELALTDQHFVNKLRRFMVNQGRDYLHQTTYTDSYNLDYSQK